ncbi:response regulator [Paenibacillus sp. UNC451MF]|uniref:response regulator n=1 Tax=Paenibacillus sp. UNC451MF TaxID=1449063 RepID=UPI0006899A96|nr:response regulator [Paenibacillus sp. UNC451MF]
MLIDDEENALDSLANLLRELCDATIERYNNPSQALKALEAVDADVIFVDIQRSRTRGIGAARKIRAKRPQVQIVFTSSSSEYAVEAFEIGSTDYLLKPFTKGRLRDTVSRIEKALPAQTSGDAKGAGRTIVQCFGGFYIHTAHGTLSWKTNKEKELCAYLMQHGGNEIAPDHIIESIWPESDLNKAKAYLYTCISFLRKNFQANGVNITVDKVGGGYVLQGQEMESDVSAFVSLVEMVLSEGFMDERQYERMNALHKGKYLENCDYHWAVWKREQLTIKYIDALRVMCKYFIKSGNMPLAADSLQRILSLSPDSEKDGRELIKLYVHENKRKEAIKVFHQLDQEVRGNLGVELEAETVQLFKSIVQNG